MAKSNERNPHITIIPLGTQAASIVQPGIYFRKHSRIKNVWLVDQNGIAASTSNWINAILQDNSGSPVTYASANTKAGVTALTQFPLALSGNDSDSSQAVSQERDVPAGTMLNANLVATGTVTTTKAIMVVEHYPL